METWAHPGAFIAWWVGHGLILGLVLWVFGFSMKAFLEFLNVAPSGRL